MMHAPGRVVFYFQIEEHVILAREFQHFFECGDALLHECAVVPQAGIEPPQFVEREIVYIAAPVGGSFERGIMDGHKSRIARQMQIRLDKWRTQLHGALKCRECVLRRVPRRTTMRDDPRFSHCRRYPSRFNRATNCLQCGPVAGTITMPKSAWHFSWPCLRASPDARHPCAKIKQPCPIGKTSVPLEAMRPMASAKSWTSALALTSHCTYQLCFQQHRTRSA